ncbi:MAG: N-acetylmuramic acid 6-phosphate etherase [Clostridiales bacterium]|nr:N-acetylmuramic acid 6-phosphate etherase [Clostridiales bacterium]
MDTQSKQYLTQLQSEQINQDSLGLDGMDGLAIARVMNEADAQVHLAVQMALPQIGEAIEQIAQRFLRGGRLFYLGAGTSGRLGVLDASECPPTFGVSYEQVQGIIAGGDSALRHASEGAEDKADRGRLDLIKAGLGDKDALVAISASGFAPYCSAALDYAREIGALAIALSCNRQTRLSQHADIAIETPTGPEVLMGSTRLKAGTATKMVLNMLSTGAMVRTGRVYKNLMVDMSASNNKLKARALRIMRYATGLEGEAAERLLKQADGSTKIAIVMALADASAQDAQAALSAAGGWVSEAVSRLQGQKA